ncbi:MAG TPA: PaaI family thioesterase [Candidatus Binataceae bacterium]|nr:PaaI family thioesterase [Candidatus Binataceae bacterium]
MASEDRKGFFNSIERAPFAAMLALRIESARDGIAIARMPFRPAILNDGGPSAPVHGGAIAALADFAACAAVWSLAKTTRSATVAMAINFTAPAIQSDLAASATVRRAGKRMASIAVEIRDRAGALVADAIVTYKIS